MVVGILDKGIQKELLQESKLSLQSCIDICRANECTKQQLQTMDQPDEVNAVDEKTPKRDRKSKSKRDPKSGKTPKLINCKFCAKKQRERRRNVRRGARPATNVTQKITFLWFATNKGRRRTARNRDIRKGIDSRDLK